MILAITNPAGAEMIDATVAQRYARALLSIAQDSKALKEVGDDLGAAQKMIDANPQLAQLICDALGMGLSRLTVSRFSNDNLFVQIKENVREKDVFVVQPFTAPAGDVILELFVIMDALRSASARRITAVIPYFGYARQDRKDEGRVPITAKLAANLITRAGADRVVAVDVGHGQLDARLRRAVALAAALQRPAADLQEALGDVLTLQGDQAAARAARHLDQHRRDEE